MSEQTMPALGTKGTCAKCGKTVWLKSAGVIGYSSKVHPGAKCFQWAARKGSKPRPILCPVTDGWPSAYHQPDGFELIYYGESDPV